MCVLELLVVVQVVLIFGVEVGVGTVVKPLGEPVLSHIITCTAEVASCCYNVHLKNQYTYSFTKNFSN